LRDLDPADQHTVKGGEIVVTKDTDAVQKIRE